MWLLFSVLHWRCFLVLIANNGSSVSDFLFLNSVSWCLYIEKCIYLIIRLKKNRKTFFYDVFLYLCASLIKITENIMKELIEKIQATYAAFEIDANAQLEKGNKAAGTRARKASLELEKMMKEFRKASLEASKA